MSNGNSSSWNIPVAAGVERAHSLELSVVSVKQLRGGASRKEVSQSSQKSEEEEPNKEPDPPFAVPRVGSARPVAQQGGPVQALGALPVVVAGSAVRLARAAEAVGVLEVPGHAGLALAWSLAGLAVARAGDAASVVGCGSLVAERSAGGPVEQLWGLAEDAVAVFVARGAIGGAADVTFSLSVDLEAGLASPASLIISVAILAV